MTKADISTRPAAPMGRPPEKRLGTKVIFRPVTGKGPGQLALEFYGLYGLYNRLMKA